MEALKQYLNSELDLSVLGLHRSSEEGEYFCTPLGARVIGWAGVDGIYYCTIEGQSETIFAVSPMNFGDYIHPIAESFEVLLRMLLSCHSMDGIEQYMQPVRQSGLSRWILLSGELFSVRSSKKIFR